MLALDLLPAGWTLSCLTHRNGRPGVPDTIPATVPGCVHTDLMAAGLLADPYLDLNEIRQDWVGRQDWQYSTAFEHAGTAERYALVFDGLDTFAEISLNGTLLGQTANMNRQYRFDVTGLLQSGTNTLHVVFRSAWSEGERLARETSSRPANYPGPANLMRKMACNFGWDWGPTLVTAGIWQAAKLESWTTARLASVRPQVTLRGADGHVRVDVDLETTGTAAPLAIAASIAGVTAAAIISPGETSATLQLHVPAPEIWWPHTLGAQPLYDLGIELQGTGGTVLDRWTRRTGFRSVRLDTSRDDTGTAFTLIVNDVPVFICGANWIPDDCFLPRVTPERYKHRIGQAKAANLSMLRVWGGGIYETDAFYQACNEAGMLVWQDFLFACAAYPEEGSLPAEIEAEARHNIARLMPHPSLVLWNGNNENIWGWFDWGWQEPLAGQTWGLGYYLGMLPKVMAETDPSRPYWPGSPYSGSMEIHPNHPDHGCMHIWDVWNDVGYTVYRSHIPRFCSEFGWQAPPAWATLNESISDDPVTPDSPGIAHHQKATNGNFKLLRGLEGHFPPPKTTEDWHFATQLNQARAIRLAFEHMRSHRGRCMGAIVWQLNDCWPVTSWAAIDSAGRAKPVWHALRAACARHLLTIQPREDGLHAVAVNDTTLFWRVPVRLSRIAFDGTVLATWTHWRLCADRLDKASLRIPDQIATPQDSAAELIVAEMGDCTAHWFFVPDLHLALGDPLADISVAENGPGQWTVTVTARTLIRDLCLMADRIDAEAEAGTMLLTLLPGQTVQIPVACPVPLLAEDLARPAVFCCANRLVAGRARRG